MLDKKYVSVVNAVLRVMPDEEIGEAISSGQKDTQAMWDWGDRSLRWITIAMTSGIACTKEHVYTALSQVSGVSKRSLRHYAAHAQYFKLSIREKYEPMPYSHFTVAKSFGDRWEEILNTSADYLENYGKYPTAEWLDWRHSKSAEPVRELNERLLEVADEMFKMEDTILDATSENDEPIVASDAQARDSLQRWYVSVHSMTEVVPVFPISKYRQDRLGEALTVLLDEIEESVKEISHLVPKGK